MNHFGKYNLTYDTEIRYTGPEWLAFLSPYYGYFPLSFNNLNANMLIRDVTHNYIGLYSFGCFYFGIFQLDNLLGIDVYAYERGSYITSLSASVPTGFWEYYYDFGYLCFIPVISAFAICYFFLINSAKEKSKIVYRCQYFWYVPLWFLMSFQNTMFLPTSIITGIFLYFIIDNSFYIKQYDFSGV